MRTSSCVRPALIALLTMVLVTSVSAERTTIPLADIQELTPPQGSEEAPRFLVGMQLPVALRGATIDLAFLRLAVDAEQGEGGEPLVVECFPVTTSWTPGAAGWSSGWDTPGGDYLASLGTSWVGAVDSTAAVSLDVTEIVQAWADSTLGAHGVILVPAGEREVTDISAMVGTSPLRVWFTRAEP